MKVFSKSSIILLCLLISSIFAQFPSKYTNMTYDSKWNRYSNNYNHGNNFKKFRKNKCCGFTFVLASALLSLWLALLILYCLLNRRKKTFTVMLRSQQENNLSNYMNV